MSTTITQAAREQTHVTAVREAPHGEPKAFCTFPLFRNHDPKQFYPCWKPAVRVDALFPVEWEGNRCAEHCDPAQPETFEI